jgi:glycosyltransferase involved in cell wall biosynthesis
MRVVIDATPLLVRSAGVKNYLYHWIVELRRAAGADVFDTFPALDQMGALDHDRSVVGRWRTVTGLAALALANYSPLPVLSLASRGARIFHASNLTRRPPRNTRLTATIHDMTCRLMPDLHSSASLRADRSFCELLSRAHRLIAVSECSKQDAVRALGLAPEKISVIHSGVAEPFFQTDAAATAAVRTRYGLERPFALFVGTIEPRKNIDALLDAWDGLPADVRQQFALVIAGPAGWASAATKARVEGHRYLGYVPEEELAPLTAAATVFAYPSLYEGFGFPVAQAMAAGVPVVTSNLSSLPEIAGDAALLVDPRSPEEIRGAISRLLLSPGLREELAARGRLRANRFRWSTCAAESLRFFREAAD